MKKKVTSGIQWPKIEIVEPTKELVKKLWKDVEDYAREFAPISYLPWFAKKKWQLLTYTHLSRYVALLLTCLVIFRERDSLWAMLSEPRRPRGVIEWLVVLCTAGTVYAFKIEIFEKRRAVSAQELRFQKAVQLLTNEFVSLVQMEGSEPQIENCFDAFATRLLEIAALAFSLPRKPPVDAGLMVKDPTEALLRLVKWSNNAQYDPNLVLKIPANNKFEASGPAAMAFVLNCLVYVPRKRGRAWPLKQDRSEIHTYWPLSPCRCWVNSEEAKQEAFETVICVPVRGLGVLNLSTREKDAFVNRDFSMAQYFADVLGHAATVTQQKTPRGA